MKTSVKYNNDGWTGSYNDTFYSAFLLYDVDTDGEEVKVQFSIVGEDGEESTPVRAYKLYCTHPRFNDQDHRYYFIFQNRRVHLDMFVGRR